MGDLSVGQGLLKPGMAVQRCEVRVEVWVRQTSYGNLAGQAADTQALMKDRGLFAGQLETARKTAEQGNLANIRRSMAASGASPQEIARAEAEARKGGAQAGRETHSGHHKWPCKVVKASFMGHRLVSCMVNRAQWECRPLVWVCRAHNHKRQWLAHKELPWQDNRPGWQDNKPGWLRIGQTLVWQG